MGRESNPAGDSPLLVSYTLEVRGLEEVMETLAERAPEKIQQHIGRGLLELAARFTETVQASISESSPPPSEPGEPPHLRTGALRRSVQIMKAEPDEVTVEVSAPYGAHLEFGTSRMEPRQFVSPALNATALEAAEIVKDAIDKNMEEAVR